VLTKQIGPRAIQFQPEFVRFHARLQNKPWWRSPDLTKWPSARGKQLFVPISISQYFFGLLNFRVLIDRDFNLTGLEGGSENQFVVL